MDENKKISQSRRNFVKGTAVALAALPVFARVSSEAFAQAPALQPIDESSPVASALGYKHDATKVDAAKFPKYQPGQHCQLCQFFSATGKLDGHPGEWGKCTIFPQGLVNAKGWCTTFQPKPA